MRVRRVCPGRLADYQAPRRFVAVDRLPHTGTCMGQKADVVALFE